MYLQSCIYIYKYDDIPVIWQACRHEGAVPAPIGIGHRGHEGWYLPPQAQGIDGMRDGACPHRHKA